MKIRFCGSLNGDTRAFDRLVSQAKCHVVQLGNLGIGKEGVFEYTTRYPSDFGWGFIAGPNDHLNLARQHENFIGDVVADDFFRIMYISTNNMQSDSELGDLIDVYRRLKPHCVVSHDMPGYLAQYLYNRNVGVSRLQNAMSRMIDFAIPKAWVFGNTNNANRIFVGGTRYTAVAPATSVDVEV